MVPDRFSVCTAPCDNSHPTQDWLAPVRGALPLWPSWPQFRGSHNLTKPPSGFVFSIHFNCFHFTRFISFVGQRTDVSFTTIKRTLVCREPRLAGGSWKESLWAGESAPEPLVTAVKGEACAIPLMLGPWGNPGSWRSSPPRTPPAIAKHSHT